MLALLLSISTVLIPPFPAPASLRGEIFGDLRLAEKYLADTKIELKCGEEVVTATTDSLGSFRLSAKASGKCTVTVTYEKQTPSLSVVVFDKPARYRLVIEAKDGKYVLKRV